MCVLYGIPNCDTVKKARAWLGEHGHLCAFHDFKKQGVPEALLDVWLAEFGWETVINRRGTSWRALPQDQRDAMTSAGARAAARHNPSLIKRPILVTPRCSLIGFDPILWQKELA